MADRQIITTLRTKRAEIERTIAAYDKRIAQAKRDLSAVNATLRLYEMDGERSEFPAYVDVSRLFKRGEMVTLARAALAEEGPLDTRELALRVIRAKGLDAEDTVLRTSVALRLVQALSIAVKRGTIGDAGRRAGVRVWALAAHTQAET